MQLIEVEISKLLSRERLSGKTSALHEFVLRKKSPDVDRQIAEICQLVPLHQLTIEDCVKGNQRAKLEKFPTYLFFVIHHFEENATGISEIHVVITESALLLIADSLPPDGYKDWTEYLNLSSDSTLSEVVHNIFDRCVDSAERRVAVLEDMVGRAELLIVEEKFDPKMILRLKQQSLRFQRAVSGTLAVVREFTAVADLSNEQMLWFRNILDHQERLSREMGFLHSEMIALFDVFWGASGFSANQQIKRLTIMATIGVPLAFWTSFFGMNFEVLPFKEPWLFGLALALMVLSVSGIFFYLKRAGLFRVQRARPAKIYSELREKGLLT